MSQIEKRKKGIILAGGQGTRLYPMTAVTCKQLLPVYDKPMIFYPLTTLMIAGIRDILIISTPEAIPLLKQFLGDGNQYGVSLSYAVQNNPTGIAEAFIIGEKFIDNDPVSLILGDNIFYGAGLHNLLTSTLGTSEGATIYATHVRDPERFGILNYNDNGKVTDIIEKPKNPPSNFAVVGLYSYDKNAVQYAKDLKPSNRGELEITDLNKRYIQEGKLKEHILGRGNMWIDVGTPEALLKASNFIYQIDDSQGMKIACPEEVALRMGYITFSQLSDYFDQNYSIKSSYGLYLSKIMDELEDTYAHISEFFVEKNTNTQKFQQTLVKRK